MDKRPHKVVFHGVREAVSLGLRASETFKNRFLWTRGEIEEARGYLIYYRDNLSLDKEKADYYKYVFGKSGEFFDLEPLARGFNAKCFTFKTIVGNEIKKWVLKIGHRQAPVVDFGDPSDPNYFKQYKTYLGVLRKSVGKYKELKYLLPEPQDVLWAVLTEGGKDTGTTIALQPFVNIIKPRALKKTITRNLRQQLLSELQAFEKLCEHLIKTYHVRPELLGNWTEGGNLEIVKIGDTYHLMLLDMGWINMDSPIPITQTVNHIFSMYNLGRLRGWIKTIEN